jgi:hypothetical protein
MRKQAIRILTMLSLLFTLTGAAVHAQSKRNSINIPFTFTVGQKTLPAGEYTFEPNRNDSNNVWLVQSTSERVSVLFTTSDTWTSKTPGQNRLVFNNYEGRYFLAEIWNVGDNTGRELQFPRSESLLAKNGVHREVVILTGDGR